MENEVASLKPLLSSANYPLRITANLYVPNSQRGFPKTKSGGWI